MDELLNMGKINPNEKKIIVLKYKSSLISTRELAKEFNCVHSTIRKILLEHIPHEEYAILKTKRQANSNIDIYDRVNHNAFSGSLSPEKAYWIGFLLADGCVDEKDRIILGLSSKDEDHVIKFQKFVKGEYYSILKTSSNNASTFRFTSHKMSSDLSKYGIVPRKSLTNNFGLNIPKYLMSHYIRGIFEGDGSFHIDTRPRLIVQIAGSEIFLKKMITNLNENNISGIGPYVTKQSNALSIQIQNKQAKKFMDWIYKASSENTRLDRKYNRWMEVKNRGGTIIRSS